MKMKEFKYILPDDLLHIITKGITYELCVSDKSLRNYTNFSNFVDDNLIINVVYRFVIYYEVEYEGGIYVLTGGFKLCKMDFDNIEMLYNNLIDTFHSGFNGDEIVNHVNVSFHLNSTILLLKEFKNKIFGF